MEKELTDLVQRTRLEVTLSLSPLNQLLDLIEVVDP